MTTYHLHIKGRVQGVGFRPFVYALAQKYGVYGWVSNSNDGVHIEFNADPGVAAQLYHSIISSPPPHAIITHHHIQETPYHTYTAFVIKESKTTGKPNLLVTPDIAICDDCKSDVLQKGNRWTHYPFTTCLHCGPRYSIMTNLPYDRESTTMAPLSTCKDCSSEYEDVYNRRHYSQTISCSNCAIPMHLYNAAGEELATDKATIIGIITTLLKDGAIVAVKGIGGYLLLCDAANGLSISILRKRKHRPAKPFALLYPDLQTTRRDAKVTSSEAEALQDSAAPIVLCTLKAQNKICSTLIAPGLGKVGVMLPYTPLLLLIAAMFGGPLVATSGNISGSPIIYKDHEALESFREVADYILTYERDIAVPQDDSVIQFTPSGQKIILRRSRGLSPTYYPNPFKYTKQTVLAMGGELKAAFALLQYPNLYVSQFLGDQESMESQSAYRQTTDHLIQLLKAKPRQIIIDQHPSYFVSSWGIEKGIIQNIPVLAVQHHRAHFGAVLAENHLLHSEEPVLGVIWDGTGYGEDAQIWGGEFFLYKDSQMQRVAHLDYFPQLLGDKMSKEARLCALSLLNSFPGKKDVLENRFSPGEWQYYNKLLSQPTSLLTSSMGRFLDGVASLLGICHVNTYEGEAAMRMEALAAKCRRFPIESYPATVADNQLNYKVLLAEMLEDLNRHKDVSIIAWKVFCSLAKAIECMSEQLSVRKIAFSGGVFQNELLTEIIIRLLAQKTELYFHHQLSPNDECIGFGQIACYEIAKKKMHLFPGKPMAARTALTL